jgi:hypothetical protein
MIGLIYKDLCVMKKSLIFNFVILFGVSLFLFVPWSRLTNELNIDAQFAYGTAFARVPFLVYLFLFITISSVQENLFSHDETRGYSAFVSASPLTARGQVLSKYYEMALLSFALLVWGYLCDRIASLVNGVSGTAMGIYITFFFCQIALRAVETPFVVRYGAKTGKQVKLVVLMGIVFVCFVYFLFGPLPSVDSDSFFDFLVQWFLDANHLSGFMLGAVAILPYVVMLLYYVSYRISCRFYQRGVENYGA